MNLRELEIFHALMKAGTTVSAATALCISQPAVSKALKHLESRMGLRLFERVSGRLRPTPEGQALYRQVKTVFGRLETLERLAQDIRQGRNGVISITATPTVAATLVAEAVARFRRRPSWPRCPRRRGGIRSTSRISARWACLPSACLRRCCSPPSRR